MAMERHQAEQHLVLGGHCSVLETSRRTERQETVECHRGPTEKEKDRAPAAEVRSTCCAQ